MSRKLHKAQLVIGTVQFGMNYGINNTVGKPSIDNVRQILSEAKDNGITELDTAQAYGDSEDCIYKALGTDVNEYTIHSKFLLKRQNTSDQIDDLLKLSLKTLHVNKLGYFFFHDFSEFDINRNKKMSSDFLINHSLGLGVSLYSIDELKKAVDTPWINAIQLPVNIFDYSDEKLKLLSEASARGQKIYCRSVFLQGLFFKNPAALPAQLQPLKSYLLELQKIAKTEHLSVADLALGFAKNIASLDVVLVGVDTVSQLNENIKSFNVELSTEVLSKLKNLNVKEHVHLLHPKNWNTV